MDRIEQLATQLATITADITSFDADTQGVQLTDEQNTRWDALQADQKRVSGELARAKVARAAVANLETANGNDNGIGRGDARSAPTVRTSKNTATDSDEVRRQADAELACRAWMMVKASFAPDARMQQAANRFGVDLNSKFFELPLIRNINAFRREQRDMHTQTGTSGGYFVDESWATSVEIALALLTSVRNVATVIRTPKGEPFHIPTLDDTAQTGEIVGEGGTHNTQDVTPGDRILSAYPYGSKIVKVSNQLIQDSTIPLAGLLDRLLARRIGQKMNTDMTTGDGSAKPTGFMTSATSAFTSGLATVITSDEVLRLADEVDDEYRDAPGACYMMHPTVRGYLSRLKDGAGRYVFPTLSEGRIRTINGYPVVSNTAMAPLVSGLPVTAVKHIAFGDFSRYYVREVGSLMLQTNDSLYWATQQTGFLATMRADGMLIDAGTHPIKYITQA